MTDPYNASNAAILQLSLQGTESKPFSAAAFCLLDPDSGAVVAYTKGGRVISNASAKIQTLAAAKVLTAADSGKTFYLNLAGGFTVTIPALAAGLEYNFIVKTAPTTAYIILATDPDTIAGYPVAADGSDQTANGNAAGDQINLVANVALPGDRVQLYCDGAVWYATCAVKATGAITITG